ncbi:MAG: AMP-binding protein [Alloprevotella sp.]|nr:AMP-binding protein [Alloprevotella sp.]
MSPSPTLEVHTSGSTGAPRPIEVSKLHMWASAEATLQALSLQPGNTALLAMPLRFIAAQMMVVRAMAGGLQLLPVVPSLHPYAPLHEAPDFAALTPAQVYESLRVPHERSLLRRTLCLIIGGGAVSPELEAELARFPNPVWSTYGMTETLSHIALRRLNGPDASPFYRPLPGVEVSLSPEGTLQIDAPAICDERVVTNDLAELTPEGFFRIRGRRDNVICTGGLKLQTETLEAQLEGLPFAFQLTHVPDARWGEAVTLLYEAEADCTQRIADFCRERLDRHAQPRHILRVDRLPLTETGKPARRAAQALAEKMLRGE